VWALAAAASLQLAPSPVYVLLVIGIAWLVVAEHGLDGPYARAFPILVGVAVFFALFRVVLIALTTHGNSDVLFTTPSFTMPEMLGGFTVGGSTTAPIVLQAGAEGLVVVGIIAVFAAFNAVVSHYELVQTTPRAFYELGLIVVVALAFVPSTIEAIRDVREADRARTGGRVVRRGRLVRQVVPVLERGLEKAVTLAESLDSRGFAHGGASSRERGAGWAGLASLVALGSGFVALVAREDTVALVLGAVGVLGLVVTVIAASRETGRIRYRPRRFTRADWICIVGSLLAPALLTVLVVTGDDTLTWSPSPVAWPTLGIIPALAFLPLLSPLARRPALAGDAAPSPTASSSRAAEVAAA
jgi:energy-coupling factor transport system permease protein